MPLQEFWNEAPDLLWVYRNSYMQKMEQDMEMMNYKAWLFGMYNYIAIGNAFSKNGKYPTKPMELYEKVKEPQQEKLDVAKRIKERAMKAKLMLELQKGR